ncbi:urease accessory protein UreE [Crocosphaera sp. UHCC 0190]|uniref:urease accessory protein UreE n=1 Tax=Crocosphaera sp. UHCC 0190 TaxID=3110246 RepID=UPI002B1F5A4F|nr:urease accessory protein UreE [Crocosphaera sp. UHCC 0190]MEA5509190.1 urease accessory protein UreE [Crocosphaera sp. UHCC 0190]
MTELADSYLGNILDNETLEKRITLEPYLEVYLTPIDSRKGRIHIQSNCGVDIGIIKSRDWSLKEGDVLETQQGKLILVHLQTQKFMVLTFTESINDCPLKLIHLGHILGNHHWPIFRQDNKIYVQINGNETVIETTIRHFAIPGLSIDYEWRASGQLLTNNHD